MIGVLDSSIQVGDFVVSLVREILFVGVIDESRSEVTKITSQQSCRSLKL